MTSALFGAVMKVSQRLEKHQLVDRRTVLESGSRVRSRSAERSRQRQKRLPPIQREPKWIWYGLVHVSR